jgi:hypothetical protein
MKKIIAAAFLLILSFPLICMAYAKQAAIRHYVERIVSMVMVKIK